MATPKKKYNYTFFYNDGAYMTFELTKEDFEKIENALVYSDKDVEFVSVSVGIIGMYKIKAIIEQKEPEQPEEDVELPPLDQESYNWIKEQLGGF